MLCREPDLREIWTNPSVCTSACGTDLKAATSMSYLHGVWGKLAVLCPGQTVSLPRPRGSRGGVHRSFLPFLGRVGALREFEPQTRYRSRTARVPPAQSKKVPECCIFLYFYFLHCFFFPFYCFTFSKLFVILQSYHQTPEPVTVFHLKTYTFSQNVIHFKLW